MPHTYTSNKKIYSVDMMHAYCNVFKPDRTKISVRAYRSFLSDHYWNVNGKTFSAMDVLNDPEKYAYDAKRIRKADLTYPIILHGRKAGDVVADGIHRLARAHRDGVKFLEAYRFNNKLMKKFLLNKYGDERSVDDMSISEFIEKFRERFES
jgi:hypothetical protein